MFEPITFYDKISFLLTIARVAASSGTLVPIAIRTRPTNVEEMFNLDAISRPVMTILQQHRTT